jgi:hypothetical protein
VKPLDGGAGEVLLDLAVEIAGTVVVDGDDPCARVKLHETLRA